MLRIVRFCFPSWLSLAGGLLFLLSSSSLLFPSLCIFSFSRGERSFYYSATHSLTTAEAEPMICVRPVGTGKSGNCTALQASGFPALRLAR